MTLGLWEERGRVRRRRRFVWRFIGVALLVGIFVAAGTWSYDIGTELARQDVRVLEQRLGTVSQENTGLQARLADIAASLDTVQARNAALTAASPSSEEQRMLSLIRKRIAAGVDPQRIAFVLGAVTNERACDVEPDTRRFIANTEERQGPNDTVGFADSTITVTAQGIAARDGDGNVLGWFDPAQPITTVFTHISGTRQEATGVLPLQQSVVVGDNEYRFNVTAGERSFVRVTADRCRYP